MTGFEFATLDLDNCSLSRLCDILTRIRLRGCAVESWEASDSTNGFHVTVTCSCGACRLVFDDATRYSKDVNRPLYAQNVLFQSRRRKLWLLRGNVQHGIEEARICPSCGGLLPHDPMFCHPSRKVPEEHVEWEK